jgi:hypothetical protein
MMQGGADMSDDLARLEQHFPSIAWRKPIAVAWPDREFFACRVCIALRGLSRTSPWQWPEKTEAEHHIRGHMQ